MKGEINMKKVFMKAGNRTLSKRLFSIMLIIGILFSMMPDATYADNSGRPPDAIEQEDTEDTESEMSDNKAAETEQDTESDEMTQDESNYQDAQAQNVQTEEDESNHDDEVMATASGQSAIMTHPGRTDYMTVSSNSGGYDYYSSNKPNYARLVKFIPNFTGVYYISSVVPYPFDTYGRLYDRNMSSLASDDDSAGNSQFKLTYRCEAGKTYYIAAGGYSNSSDNRSLAVSIAPSIYAVLYNTGELHFQYGETADPAKGSVVNTYQVASSYSAPYQVPWLQKNTSIVKVTSDNISCSTGGITSIRYWFHHCENLTSIDLSKFDTGNVTDMSYAFSECSKLTSLNLSNFNTSNVTNMSNMFDGCSNLTSLNLSSFNTSKVTNMNGMFWLCSKLTSLNLSNFDTSKVTDMNGMFCYCSSLIILDVSSLDTSNVTDMSYMFQKCSNLKVINLRGKFSTESLKSCNNIFTGTTADLLCNGNEKNAFPAAAYDYGKYIVLGPEYVYTGSQIVRDNLQHMVLKPYKKDVKFDANGGTGTITIHVGVNDAIFNDSRWWSRKNICNNFGSLDDGIGHSYPTKSFYTFMGFFTQDGKELSNVNLITEDVYYAHWTPTNYSISYNLNGGSLSGQKTSYNIETANFTLPTPSKFGYTFTGWTGSNGTTAQKSVTITKGSTGNKSYTAHWTPVNYTISYNANGGSLSGQKTSYNVESATFTLPTPSKFGYTFTGWTGTGLSGLTKTVTVSKGSTGNRTYTAHFEKTVTATFKYYNNQIVTVTGKITDSATSVAVKAPAASGTPSGYTFRGWSTSSAANASVNAAASASVTISANMTYYASYSKNVTATFHYCTLAADNYTYTNGAQKSAAASATQYLGYAGAVVNSNIAIPSAVTASHGGASAQNYVGVSKDTNSVSTITPTTAYTKYYAVYTEPLKFYYYNGTNDTSTSVTRRMLSNGSAYSNSLSASAPAPAAYDGAAFAGWSCDSGVSDSSSLRKPLETGVNSLYAVYKKNVSMSYNTNGGSGAPAAQSGTKYYAKKESGSNITNPLITVTSSKPSRGGYNFSSWNTSANGSGTVYKAGTAYAVSANVTLYAQWTVNTYTNWIQHWTWGYKNQEGNNGYKTAFQLDTTAFKSQYGSTFTMDSAKAVKVPNGFYLLSFGTNNIDGVWKDYQIGTKVIQKDCQMGFQYDYQPYDYSITYNLNGGTNNNANPSTYNVLYGVTLKAPTRAGYTFTGWYDENGNKIAGINEGCNAKFSSADDLYAKLATRTTGNRTLTAHWSYNPVKVKVPQVLIANHAGTSQFRVKCDDFKAGNIKVTVPNSFSYKQAGKADVTAVITAKSGNNVITPSNKVCVYNITTTNGLSAGCWQGSFNIGLTLTKE